jgi:hypothetical protein
MKDCCRKHLSQASILLEEYATGDYDVHFWYAIGHMAEAESESIAEYPEFAALVRAERIKMIETEGYFTDFEYLIEMASQLAEREIDEKKETKSISVKSQGN